MIEQTSLMRVLKFVINIEAVSLIGITAVVLAYYRKHPLRRHIAALAFSYLLCVISLAVGFNRGAMTASRAVWTTVAITLGLYGLWQLVSYRQKMNLKTSNEELQSALNQDIVWRKSMTDAVQEIVVWVRKRNVKEDKNKRTK